MDLYEAKKVTIITEKMILKGVCEIIDECGASGYTVIPAGGKGSRNIRSTSEHASVIDDFANVIVETIVKDRATADAILKQTSEKYFQNYPGIAYLENVQIVRPAKFKI